ncbi:MAG: 16S rRNA (adenine(1518)-N(6)/adenine(1519)-N(6))-dimethyltransferase RsmA [Pseudomonadota bacterium]|nr:16S rRNA (adenine(1518)-N(6)/adenine(1519)-N(6))-dimethyltransferase RsmA [Pseudomonadota bacterium]
MAPPRKRFGQHFLHDRTVIRRILDAVQPAPDQRLVEIGPGRGALTRPLLERAGELDAVEVDRDLIARLAQLKGGTLRLHNADALTLDFAALRRGDPRRLRVVGNLPYNISTPLLFHLLEFAPHIADMHFMLQREVVERLAAGPGGADYGRLSVMVQYRCRVEPLWTVGPGAFYPPPKVQSAFVRLVPHPRPPVAVTDEARFAAVVREAFSQRRKTLRNSLRRLADAAAIAAAGIDPGARPETLSLADFAALSNRLSAASGLY